MNSSKILALETSGHALSVACGDGKTVTCRFMPDAKMRHSEILKDVCREALEERRWALSELTALAVCTGPGSFTGLRVGISFARALAQSLRIPLIGVPAFEAIARGVFETTSKPGILCVLIDSIGEEVFAGFFRAGQVKPLEPYRLYGAKALEARLKALKRPVTFAKNLHPQARHMIPVAIDKLKSGKTENSWKKVLPLYMRASVAEERLGKMLL